MARVRAAADVAECRAFIEAFRGGFDTFAGSRGGQLSGGERQRVAIARAAIRDADLLVLDEATSALDAKTESAVQDALSRITKGRTTVVIAHRLSTIRDADCIVCMQAGRAVETGTHEQLMERRGVYYGLVEKQLRKSQGQELPH